MGNSTSGCFLLQSSAKAKLIDGDGNLKKVKLPIRAAEIMIEEPGHVVSRLDSVKGSRRVSAMRADDELLAGNVYVLVPVGRVHRKVTEEEIAMIEAAACEKKGRRRRMNGAKVLPTVNDEEKGREEGGVKDFGGTVMGFPGHGSRNLRRWNPGLEAISEVC